MENQTLNPITDLIIEQSLQAIAKSSLFGNIPVVNSVITTIAKKSIIVALHNTVLSRYIKQIEDEVLKQAAEVKDIRERLKDKSLTKEERAKYEDDLKTQLRSILSFKP